MEILADEDGALEINEEVMESYDRIKEDIEVHLPSAFVSDPVPIRIFIYSI